ncbi:MAG: PepSY-like domain-containing protein [Bacteroidetes bacterium]|nr:PepSY-like domain-containing protein [Bacteroidota bacterium]
MKKILVLAMGLFVLSNYNYAQNGQKASKKSLVVPTAVAQSFAKDFAGVKPKWSKEDANFEANFKKEGKTMSAVYGPSGNLMETEEDIPVAHLMQSIKDYVAKNYKGKKIKEAAIITRANGEVNYEAEVDGKDLLFTKQGQFIKAVND